MSRFHKEPIRFSQNPLPGRLCYDATTRVRLLKKFTNSTRKILTELNKFKIDRCWSHDVHLWSQSNFPSLAYYECQHSLLTHCLDNGWSINSLFRHGDLAWKLLNDNLPAFRFRSIVRKILAPIGSTKLQPANILERWRDILSRTLKRPPNQAFFWHQDQTNKSFEEYITTQVTIFRVETIHFMVRVE